MKHTAFLLCALFLLALAGCGKTEVPVYAPVCGDGPQTEETAATQKHEPQTEASTVPTEAAAEIPKKPVIETRYYSLPLPDHWKEACAYTVTDDTVVTLREAGSFEAFGGGKLCSLLLIPTSDDTYKDFPDYELLCALDTPDGSFYVIVLFPTDVQFNEDTAEAYNAMAEELMGVLWDITPKDGIEMAMP